MVHYYLRKYDCILILYYKHVMIILYLTFLVHQYHQQNIYHLTYNHKMLKKRSLLSLYHILDAKNQYHAIKVAQVQIPSAKIIGGPQAI